MSIIKFDSSKAGTGFALLPAGNYEAIIEKGEVKKASTGSDMIAFRVKLRDDVDQEGKNRVFFSNVVFNENTEGIVQGFLKAVGAQEGQEFSSFEEIKNFAVGKPVSVKLAVGSYKGEERNEVKYINPSKAEAPKPKEGDDPFAAPHNPASTPPPFEVNDDDLPF